MLKRRFSLKLFIIPILRHIWCICSLQYFCSWYIRSKMLSSYLNSMLTLSKMTSPPKLFDYDCMTLYLFCPSCFSEPWSRRELYFRFRMDFAWVGHANTQPLNFLMRLCVRDLTKHFVRQISKIVSPEKFCAIELISLFAESRNIAISPNF